MASSSTKVVYAALAGNVLVAISKYAAAFLSGSGAMLTEAIHSTADSANQVLLLIGDTRSAEPADDSHNFGHGAEVYFWTFVVAVLVLLVGGVASLVAGYGKLRAPEPIAWPGLSLGVLAAAGVFEGASLLYGIREARRTASRHGSRPFALWRFIELSKDPNLYETLLEDGAALVGVAIAAAGVIASVSLGWLWADGAASCAIGILLVADALVILSATRSLISGESVAPAFATDLRAAIDAAAGLPAVRRVETLHIGPHSVLVALTFTGMQPSADALSALAVRIRAVDPRIRHVLVRVPDNSAKPERRASEPGFGKH